MKNVKIIYVVTVVISMGCYLYWFLVDPLQLKLQLSFAFATFWFIISLLQSKRKKLAILLVVLFTVLSGFAYYMGFAQNIFFHR